MKSVLPLVTVLLSGCYAFWPDIPTTKITPVEGQQIEFSEQKRSQTYHCSENDDDCEVGKGGKIVQVSRWKEVSAEYNGKKLTQYDLHALVDPDFDAHIAHIRSKKGTCKVSLVPTAIAFVGGVVAIVGLGLSGVSDDTKLKMYLVGGGTAAVFGGLSYPLGGYACYSAHKEYNRLFDGIGGDTQGYPYQDNTEAYTELMVKLAAEFNAKHPAAAEPEEPATDVPAEPAPGE